MKRLITLCALGFIAGMAMAMAGCATGRNVYSSTTTSVNPDTGHPETVTERVEHRAGALFSKVDKAALSSRVTVPQGYEVVVGSAGEGVDSTASLEALIQGLQFVGQLTGGLGGGGSGGLSDQERQTLNQYLLDLNRRLQALEKPSSGESAETAAE